MLWIIIIVVVGIGLYFRMKNRNDTWSDVNVSNRVNTWSNGQNSLPTSAPKAPSQPIGERMVRKAETAINNAKGNTPQIKNAGDSMRDPEGYGTACVTCGTPVIGYGRAGGYCPKCNSWSVDRAKFSECASKYGPKSYTMFTLMAYDQSSVNVRSNGKSYSCVMCVTPRSLILRDNQGFYEDVLFDRIYSISASKGVVQQLTIVLRTGDGPSDIKSISIDLKGASFDGAGGEDLFRIKQLYETRF